ncbi:hypothetical protein C8D99_10911 [Aminivibrio pyruvatiphilus]|jgi:hypothetical protein|uniref:Pyrimidine dimer DNA glycosylase /DNA-(Apurinic or apyrimidinic site) lyase n=1 Tax=Aminivibrio pyruvatiphilus TaxID=1005740 RepID=A0A4R8M5S0_9BACT|nr:MSMEG_6728 family protein [Aminivibrio pyruvatiphilus]TDY60158.1 hypothetical protein C8D99_10911 [Aminivibrio pyruvatiphilus]
MQTFLPYPDFFRSAEVLDVRRLGKQRVEAFQLLNALSPEYALRGWRNHPARIMWSAHPSALAFYGVVVCRRWTGLGYRDTCRDKILGALNIMGGDGDEERLEGRYRDALAGKGREFLPPWFGDETFHRSHRSNLLRKDPEWYGRFGWSEGPDLPYAWPVPAAEEMKRS